MGHRFAFFAFALSFAVTGCDSCKKKTEQVKKELVEKKRTFEKAPLPPDAFGEIVVRDPESFVKRASDGAGLGPMVGPSPWQKVIDSVSDETTKKALSAIDPHGAVAAVGLFKFAPGEKAHGVAAAKLKDPTVASSVLDAASKSGGALKSWRSEVLDCMVYEPSSEGEVAVYGDVVLVADTRGALESAGKYVAYRATQTKLDHELTLVVPMDSVGPRLKKVGLEEWAKVPPSAMPAKVKSELDAMADPFLTGVADMTELRVDVDLTADEIKYEEKIDGKGSYTAWTSKLPTGDASPLLTLPKAENAGVLRFGDGLAPLFYALVDWGLDSATLTPAERTDAGKQARALGKSLGHLAGYAYDMGKGTGVNTEVFLRLDLDDAAGAKAAVPALVKHVIKALGGKPTTAPYKKFGADGESIATAAVLPSVSLGAAGPTATKDTWTWAIKGSSLILDACLGCAPALVDPALDPATKGTLGDDAAIKAKIADFPTKGVVNASYASGLGIPGAPGGLGMLMGAPAPAPKRPGVAIWGYMTTSPQGLYAKGVMPLVFVGDLVKTLAMLSAAGGMMGGPPPPF